VVVALLRLGQERGLDGLTLHLPQVRLEVNVGPLKRFKMLNLNLHIVLSHLPNTQMAPGSIPSGNIFLNYLGENVVIDVMWQLVVGLERCWNL